MLEDNVNDVHPGRARLGVEEHVHLTGCINEAIKGQRHYDMVKGLFKKYVELYRINFCPEALMPYIVKWREIERGYKSKKKGFMERFYTRGDV